MVYVGITLLVYYPYCIKARFVLPNDLIQVHWRKENDPFDRQFSLEIEFAENAIIPCNTEAKIFKKTTFILGALTSSGAS